MKGRQLVYLALAAVVVLAVGGSTVLAATAKTPRPFRFAFTGELLADPGSNASSVAVQVGSGNGLSLQKLVGQSQNQTFSVGANTEYLKWSKGVPTVVSSGALKSGDVVTVRVRAPRSASLAQIESIEAAIVSDRGPNPGRAHRPLWLFRGTLNGPVSGNSISLHIGDGNHRALRAMLGQGVDQTFSLDATTIFLRWAGKVPSVIAASQLDVGGKITIRIRAPRGSSLAQVEATPANKVAEHEPAPPAS
jgi:hypothetical protein